MLFRTGADDDRARSMPGKCGVRPHKTQQLHALKLIAQPIATIACSASIGARSGTDCRRSLSAVGRRIRYPAADRRGMLFLVVAASAQ